MKRLFILILSMTIFSSCSAYKPSSQAFQSKKTSVPVRISDFFPFQENKSFDFYIKGEKNSEANYRVEYIAGNKIQIRESTNQSETGRVYEVKNNAFKLIYIQNNYHYRLNLINHKANVSEILLKEPIAKNNSWKLPDGRKRTITNLDVVIKTSSGSYNTIELTTEGADGSIIEYYAPGIGLIKRTVNAGNKKTEMLLSKIQEDTYTTQTIKFYYPDFPNQRIVYTKNKIIFKTNDSIDKLFEKYFKSPPGKDISKDMGPLAKIKNISFDSKKRIANIDFSSEFIKQMNAGVSLEYYIIQSVVNTLGDYFSVDKVYVTIDGKPYESGHFAIHENETFYVDYKNVAEYK